MSAYLIGYDLYRPGQDYKGLKDEIKALGTWWHNLDSTWIVVSTLSAVQIRDRLTKHIDSNDELLVAKLSGEAAWFGFSDEGSKWLKQNL